MPKRLFLPFLPGFLVLVTAVGGSIAGPEARTQAYFGLQRQWEAHWPLKNGKKLPRLIQPALEPFTPIWVQLEPGIKMQLDPYDYVSREILETGVWEPDSWAAIERHLGKDATFVDVGAHIGYYSQQTFQPRPHKRTAGMLHDQLFPGPRLKTRLERIPGLTWPIR